MTTLVNYKADTCPPIGGSDTVVWSGVVAGALSLSPTGTSSLGPWTPFATIPITTGSVPLADGLWCLIWVSWEAKSATAGKFSIARRALFGAVQGAASSASYNWFPAQYLTGVPGGLLFERPTALYDYVQITGIVNGSGDFDLGINCLATDSTGHAGVGWDFTNMSVEYQIVGCQ